MSTLNAPSTTEAAINTKDTQALLTKETTSKDWTSKFITDNKVVSET
jgi:hypothetical protein